MFLGCAQILFLEKESWVLWPTPSRRKLTTREETLGTHRKCLEAGGHVSALARKPKTFTTGPATFL